MSAHELITEHLDLWTQAVTKKSTAGRGSNGKVELTGIKKLRELILELAVRGKLVEQDPDDEPASVLLEQVANEKIQLAKVGQIKKPQKSPPILPEDIPFNIPKGWHWVRLGELTKKIGSGATPRGGKSAYVESGVPFLRSQNIWNDGLNLQDVAYIPFETHERMSNTHVFPSDILLNITGASLGRCAVVPVGLETANVSQHVTIIRTIDPLSRLYLHYLMLSPYVQSLIWGRQVGMAREGLSKKVLEQFEIPLPSLAEQHRIVQKVDELMALCDRLEQHTSDQLGAHETLVDTLLGTLTQSANATELADNWARLAEHFDTLFTTEQSIDKLKQTILQLAVTGQLVEQDAGDESVNTLLDRLSSEKRRLIKEKVLKKPKALEPLDTSKFSAIPEHWSWVNLGDVIGIMDAGWSPACPSQPAELGNWGVLKTTAVQVMQYLEFENKKLPANKAPKEQYEVHTGDILITRAGPKNRVGISCVIKETRDKLMISDKIIRFHLIEAGLSEEYICLCLNAGETYGYLEQAKSGMAESQMNISQDKLKAAPIPLCPANEQHRIVQKVDELMALCDHLKQHLNQASNTRCQLAGAVVEGALN
ncbi:restriction endonuclease subunit S [Vreelandella profundi]|uniref:restriction endonuclease subunit S n=1 Tax=Vreelandella profundi TaxID=2852117 RepID=UPI001F01694D|nr:restriction endonuclease subunit S [Halomonas profundi]